MKKLISFRTDVENKRILMAKAKELGMTLSDYLDQITTESYFEIMTDQEREELADKNRKLMERGFYLRTQIWKMIKILRNIPGQKDDKNYHRKVAEELVPLIEETFNKQRKMLAE